MAAVSLKTVETVSLSLAGDDVLATLTLAFVAAVVAVAVVVVQVQAQEGVLLGAPSSHPPQ